MLKRPKFDIIFQLQFRMSRTATNDPERICYVSGGTPYSLTPVNLQIYR